MHKRVLSELKKDSDFDPIKDKFLKENVDKSLDVKMEDFIKCKENIIESENKSVILGK